jgi:hypothetical protein
MRRLAALILLLAGVVPAPAQWQIFAENPPKPGTWSRYQYETIREGKVVAKTELSLSIRSGMDIAGKPHVWFTVEPVGWLGSREHAPLRLLLSADLDRARASRLIENAQEIVFSNPVKGSYHMTRDDIAWVSKWANLTYASELSADTPAQETIQAAGKPFACERMKMLASTVTDPPIVPKQTIEFKGTVWRSDKTPFGVVRAEWLEKTTKKDRNREETRRLTLLASGWERPPTEPIDRGKDFSVWRLIFNR